MSPDHDDAGGTSDPEFLGKRRAAEAAAAMVEPNMLIGLGSGTTASLVIRALGRRVAEQGLRLSGVATSVTTAQLARSLGIPLVDLDSTPGLDLAIDGADEVDPAFRMIKGRGGALLREKIVAAAARRRVIVVTPDKRVDRLGRHVPVPVEVSEFGLKHTEHALRNLGATTSVRQGADGSAFLTDEGHRILDCRFQEIGDPDELNRRLKEIVGVFETGLFIGLCDQLVVGTPEGFEIHDRPDHSAAPRST